MDKFKDISLIDPIQRALEDVGYVTPTPIQIKAIPEILAGRDILGYAQTGTGKTAAFTLPILQGLEHCNSKSGIKALIVTPTRELAIQIGENIAEYSKYLTIKHTVIFGGVPASKQIAALRRGVQILVATPGRLLDLQNQGYIKINNIDYFVLDEADRMLDMGFIHDIKKILKMIPQKRQTLFFSATMPQEIEKLASSMLKNPLTVEVEQKGSVAEHIEQFLFFVSKQDKNDLLVELLKDKALNSVLLFTRTKHGADKIVKILDKNGINAAAIHGNKSQNARQRALKSFKDHELRVLIATDIAARGIDVDSISHVINYELPNIPETYIHRIGRTARAGKEGIAFSFCQADERLYLRDIEKLIKMKIPRVENHPFVEELTGTEAEQRQQMRPKKQPSRNSSRNNNKNFNRRSFR